MCIWRAQTLPGKPPNKQAEPAGPYPLFCQPLWTLRRLKQERASQAGRKIAVESVPLPRPFLTDLGVPGEPSWNICLLVPPSHPNPVIWLFFHEQQRGRGIWGLK